MEQVNHAVAPHATGDSLIVIVADSAEQRVALTADLPETTPILMAKDLAQAGEVLAGLPGAPGQPRAAEARRPGAQTRRPGQPGARWHLPVRDGVHRPGGMRLREDRLSLAMGEREVQLTRLEFALMEHFLARLGEVVTFEQLSQVGWQTAYLGSGAHMHAAIGRLRTKVARLGAPVALQAVRGLGFRLTAHEAADLAQEAVGN